MGRSEALIDGSLLSNVDNVLGVGLLPDSAQSFFILF
jgi:hypothetical protein